MSAVGSNSDGRRLIVAGNLLCFQHRQRGTAFYPLSAERRARRRSPRISARRGALIGASGVAGLSVSVRNAGPSLFRVTAVEAAWRTSMARADRVSYPALLRGLR